MYAYVCVCVCVCVCELAEFHSVKAKTSNSAPFDCQSSFSHWAARSATRPGKIEAPSLIVSHSVVMVITLDHLLLRPGSLAQFVRVPESQKIIRYTSNWDLPTPI